MAPPSTRVGELEIRGLSDAGNASQGERHDSKQPRNCTHDETACFDAKNSSGRLPTAVRQHQQGTACRDQTRQSSTRYGAGDTGDTEGKQLAHLRWRRGFGVEKVDPSKNIDDGARPGAWLSRCEWARTLST